MGLQGSLIAEVESAVSSGSADHRVETLRRVTDLFMGGADSYSEEHVGVFDDVISRLAEKIETKARVELARRLAPVKNAPVTVVRALARDESIEVSGPVLSQSPRLTEQDLLEVAQNHGQDRLLAISKRMSISEAVSDVLVTRGDREVVRSVARNEGARFSRAGYGKLVEKSAQDDELAVSVAQRKDISKEQFQALVAKASEAVFKKLAASNPTAVAEVKRVLQQVTGGSGAAKANRIYAHAKAQFERIQSAGESIDAAVYQFAKSGKFEEVVVALSALCHLPTEVVEHVMTDKRVDRDLVLILSKAANLSWPTAKFVLTMRKGEGGLAAQDMDTAQKHFDRLQAVTAQRVVRFYQVRHAAGEKAR